MSTSSVSIVFLGVWDVYGVVDIMLTWFDVWCVDAYGVNVDGYIVIRCFTFSVWIYVSNLREMVLSLPAIEVPIA
eukprot:1317676-Amorphochlora_amoeboformis.AAC.1